MSSTPSVLLTVGTRKGVFLLRSSEKRDSWQITGPFAGGIDSDHAVVDPRTGTIYATSNNPWFGPQVSRSEDGGETWVEAKASPRLPGDPVINEGAGFEDSWFARAKSLDRLWRIEPGRDTEPGVMYCGVAPASLFRSDDGGDTWHLNEALDNHPAKQFWNPGAGGLCLHSIVLDPADTNRMWIAISAGGVYRTDDGGQSWQPAGQGIRSEAENYDPNIPRYPEVGQCVHHVELAGGSADRLYAQSHAGTYRSENGGDSWTEITEGLPSDFALSMTAHPHDPDTAYVLPLQGGELRCPPEGKLRVFRTRDAGANWEPMTKGLPQENAFMGVYRQGLCTDTMEQAGVYLGTNTGQIYASKDEGDSWDLITQNLPPVLSVSAAVVA